MKDDDEAEYCHFYVVFNIFSMDSYKKFCGKDENKFYF